ncbi:hypothetical protein B0H14DRAFT_2884116 [Mycena olivaceomarginata]|nr:hypothetical protein B0H14DRAFT_2884116 [Mycena olivaceomarginata]
MHPTSPLCSRVRPSFALGYITTLFYSLYPSFSPDPPSMRVGIVGGGIAGLYTALLLKRQGIDFHILEGSGRVGGRVFTHFFCPERDQYFEAGAMRIPKSTFHQITYDLIDYLNLSQHLIPYVLFSPGNNLYINGVGSRGEVSVQTVTPQSVNWDVPYFFRSLTANELMSYALRELVRELDDGIANNTFEATFRGIAVQWDRYSFRTYLMDVLGYPCSVVDFMETVISQTNNFALSVVEILMQYYDFSTTDWKTIDQGMSRLPRAMEALIGRGKITYGARVQGLRVIKAGYEKPPGDWHLHWPPMKTKQIEVTATGYNGRLTMLFDKVVMAEMAIRSMFIVPLYKMGMRFKRRFWESTQNAAPSLGGQSTTDLPIRWIVYPSNGIESGDSGVLVIYAWMTDATSWTPLTTVERRSLAIQNLEKVYSGCLDAGETIASLLIETADAVWSDLNSTGDSFGLPGQFLDRFDQGRKAEGNIYFAGEHLSYHHTWISGAAESALYVVRDMLNDQTIQPLKEKTGFRLPKTMPLPFKFEHANPLLVDTHPVECSDKPLAVPIYLGECESNRVGPILGCLRSVQAGA